MLGQAGSFRHHHTEPWSHANANNSYRSMLGIIIIILSVQWLNIKY